MRIKNLIGNLISRNKYDLFYIVEKKNWSIHWDGKYITDNINSVGFLRAKITTNANFVKNKIIHFGSANTLTSDIGIRRIDNSNKIVLTWFHVVPNDSKNNFIKDLNEKVDIVHTSCQITKNELMNHGIRKEKIVVIPIGVDLNRFKELGKDEKDKIRKELKIPEGKIIIGSFQKDGNGWGEGNEPKLIKGPDVFCDVVERLSKKLPIHVLLTGPARGYVKNRLKKANIDFTHVFLDNYLEIPKYYNALDLYLVTSRAEGGPKAVLESIACGVPLVTTRVGMAPDVVADGENGMLCEIGDVEGLEKKSLEIIESEDLRRKIISAGLETVKKYSWGDLVKEYYKLIYEKLL